MELLLNKNAPKDLASVGRCIIAVGGTYVVLQGNLARYQSQNRGLNLEIEIDSLRELETFSCSFSISPGLIKNLGSLSQGAADVTFSTDHNKNQHLMTNQKSLVILEHLDVNLMMPTIHDSLKNSEKIGPPINLSSRHELGLTGRESSTYLVLRDNTFTGILNSSGEYYFDANYREETSSQKQLLQNCFFLKLGSERFELQLYLKEKKYMLLTTVSIGTGIQCSILETSEIQ